MTTPPDIKAALEREAYFQYLAEEITRWETDPKAYDLRLVAHEIQKATGQARIDAFKPGDFIALLGRCKRRNANPPEPVPPMSAREIRSERSRRLREEEGVLLDGRPLFWLPAAYRGPWPHQWQPVDSPEPGGALSQLVVYDRPQAPVDEVMVIAATIGYVAGSDQQRVWYRAYCKINRHGEVEVQILAEGATGSPVGARTVVGRRVNAFLREQCISERLPDEPPPDKQEVYFVQVPVLLNEQDVRDLSSLSHQAEMSTVVSRALKRYAAKRRQVRAEQAVARQARQGASTGGNDG